MSRPILKRGMEGEDVSTLQNRLYELGFFTSDIDGIFGDATFTAVINFQVEKRLTGDGIVGSATWTALYDDSLADANPEDSVLDFVSWALTHAKRESIPDGAKLLIPIEACGTEPWEYLYGTSSRVCTQALLNSKFEDPYKGWGWDRALFNKATAGWVEKKQIVCDCQGLLDAYCTQVLKVKTDLNAHGCYSRWCPEAGKIKDISRAYVIGEAVFRANDYGTMKHIGWICGFAADGEPLVIEERGLSYGCVVTRLSGRGWTHRGLMTKRFVYVQVKAGPYFATCSGGSVNIRDGAGKDFAKVAVAHLDDLILALPDADGWSAVAVAIEGKIVSGYMSSKYIREA